MNGRFVLLLLLFFGSGACALAYEVVWIRLLSLTLSVTVYSLTTVLCAFMTGLALGAAVGSAWADRIRRPLVAFGLAELGIAASGIAIPPILFDLGPSYQWLYERTGGHGAAFGATRFLLATGILLVPTTLMGVTLPLLSRAVIDRLGFVARGAGALYAANTIGAVLGCVAAGFLLIPALGLRGTSACAAAANVAIGLVAIAWGLATQAEARAEPAPEAEPAPRSLPWGVRIAAAVYLLSGFTALGYEVLWTRALEHYTHNSTYAYTAMLATFLAGLGVGSAVMSRFADRLRRPLLGLALLQLGVGLSVVSALSIYARFETLVPAMADAMGGLSTWRRAVALIFGEAILAMLVTTLLLGAMFPLVARIAVDSLGRVGRRIGAVYLGNTVGSILGSLVVGFGLLPWLGLRGAFLTLVSANLLGGGLVALAALPRPVGRAALAASALLLAACFAVVPPELFARQFETRFGELLFYREEVTDTVMVTEAEDGSRMIRYGDGRGTAGTPTVIGDRMYAHIPLLLHPEPRHVLQICFGVGNSLSSVLQYPVERVDAVELSPGVIEAAPYFRATNRDSIDDPRVQLWINDGRNFLLTSRERYDVIRLDPPELHTAGIVNLYTREFYELARSHLAEGGIFSIWFNGVMTPVPDIRAVLRTVADVFPHVSVWHDPHMFSWVVNGSLEPHDPDLRVLRRHFARDAVRSDLESIGISDPFRFLRYFVFADDSVRRWAGDGPLVVDDHTRLDFSVPRSRDSSYGIANYTTDNWLVDRLEPAATHDVAFATFARKVRELAGHKQPVLPHLRGIEDAGFTRDEVARRVRDALEELPVH